MLIFINDKTDGVVMCRTLRPRVVMVNIDSPEANSHFREHAVHAPAPAQGQVLHEQAGHHRAADRAGHGLPPPPRHRPQGM